MRSTNTPGKLLLPVLTNPHGKFALEAPTAGTYRIEVHARGFAKGVVECEVVEGSRTDVSVRLRH